MGITQNVLAVIDNTEHFLAVYQVTISTDLVQID